MLTARLANFLRVWLSTPLMVKQQSTEPAQGR
jgi:hypothetical protein